MAPAEELIGRANDLVRGTRLQSSNKIVRFALIELFPDMPADAFAIAADGSTVIGLKEACLVILEPYEEDDGRARCRASIVPWESVSVQMDYRFRWSSAGLWSDGNVGTVALGTEQGEHHVNIVDGDEPGAHMQWLDRLITAKASP